MGKPVIKGDFKCGCTNPNCKLEEQVQRRADILGVSVQMVAFSLSLLKNTAGATPIAGLKELSGGLLAVVIAIQDKREVKGGLKHIIVDCLKVTCIVCQHARRRKHKISPVIETAISELNLELSKIKEEAEKMNKRGWFMRFIMGSADKATVNALRQQLTTSWGLFSTELQMDTNYKVTKADKVDPAEVWKRMFDEMAAKHQIGRHAPAPPPNASARRHSGYDLHNQRQQAERDHTLRRAQGDPHRPDDVGRQVPHDQQPQRQQDDDRYPFQSQTGQPSRPSHQYYPRSEPVQDFRLANPHNNQSYGHEYSRQSQPVLPPPLPSVNQIGVAGNINFGTNYGEFNQTSYR